MLRALVAALLLVNLAFFAWTEGWLDSVIGARPSGDREPERLARQVRPESVRILPAGLSGGTGGTGGTGATKSAPSPVAASEAAPSSVACMEAGPFNDAEFTKAQATVQSSLPVGSWSSVKVDVPGVWIIYMGKFANREAVAKKEDELKRRKLQYEVMSDNPTYALGISLGRYPDRTSASKAFEAFGLLGIHTGRVVEMTPASATHLLRVEKADAGLVERLSGIKFEPPGKSFAACAIPPSN